MTSIDVHGLEVIFPFRKIYAEQMIYMEQLKVSLTNEDGPNKSCILEMPVGAGRQIAMFSVLLSLMEADSTVRPLIVCVNSLASLNSTLKSLKLVHEKRLSFQRDFDSSFRAIPLLNRRFSCINDSVSMQEDFFTSCAAVTAWDMGEMCPSFSHKIDELPLGVMDVNEFKSFCREHGECPYFAGRRLCETAQVVVCASQEIVDPRYGAFLREKLGPDAIIVFDDASSLDTMCYDTLSFYVDQTIVDGAIKALDRAESVLDKARKREQQLLDNALQKLRNGVTVEDVVSEQPETLELFRHPVPKRHQLQPCLIPGSLRDPKVFLSRMRNLVDFFDKLLKSSLRDHDRARAKTQQFSSRQVLSTIRKKLFMEPEMLQFMTTRLSFFVATHRMQCFDVLTKLWVIADFAAVLATYDDGISVLVRQSVDPRIDLCCLDAAISFQEVARFSRLVLTGEMISPFDMYCTVLFPKNAQFTPVAKISCRVEDKVPEENILTESNLLPLIVVRKNEQTPLTISNESALDDDEMADAFGHLVSDAAESIADGILVLMPSASFMETMFKKWMSVQHADKEPAMQRIMRHKMVFIETSDRLRSALSLEGYMRACDSGRGAIFFGIAGGRLSSGVDLSGRYCRCYLVVGIPQFAGDNPLLEARARFVDKEYLISRNEFFLFNSVRLALSPMQRILNSKSDYAIVIFADDVFQSDPSAGVKFPAWFRPLFQPELCSMIVDSALSYMTHFMSRVSQVKSTKTSIDL